MRSTTERTLPSRKAATRRRSLRNSRTTRQAVRRRVVERDLQPIFKNMINAFIVWESVFDENGRYVSFRFGQFNDAYARIAKPRQEEVLGKDVFDVSQATEKGWVEV